MQGARCKVRVEIAALPVVVRNDIYNYIINKISCIMFSICF